MKKSTFLTFLIILFAVSSGFAQKVAIIGMNHVTPDGFSFVATEAIFGGEVIYFTENEYVDATNSFTAGESVIRFDVTSDISTGDVFFLKETSSNVFAITHSGTGSGTAIKTGISGSFSISTNGEGYYAYGDTDDNPENGITEIYSVLYTGSGEAPSQNGGNIPASMNPISDFPNAIVVDGFPDDGDGNVGLGRVEYKFAGGERSAAVSKTTLKNASNYLHTSVANADLSIIPFTNLNLAGSNPALTLTATPSSVTENSGSAITYTFNLSANAGSNITVNFSVGGTATFNTDYTSSGASTFNASSGTATISAGSNSTSFTITPTADADLEPNETIIVGIAAGTGYDAGSPSLATNTILNDDTESITPLVAVTGLNHTVSDGFSFVALDDISAGTIVYFTENSFDNGMLAFTGSEAVISWVAPAAGISKGEVIVATETSANLFTLTGSTTNGITCGTISIVSGSFSTASTGEGFFAYTDSDANPNNGIGEVHSVLFAGTATTAGGNIPAIEDPAAVYVGAVVVDGFPAIAPDRVEYDPAKRNVTVDKAGFQNTGNWLHAQNNQVLSIIPFSNIIISSGSANPAATVVVSSSSVAEDSGSSLNYTFSLSSAATTDVTVNFTVGGSATFNTDYSVTGAASFTASSGSVVIATGTSSKTISITPIADSDVEVLESVDIAISSGIGYDGGSPNDAIGKISNDDTKESNPLVAITGLNHTDADGFSFVAAKDIPASSTIYFTENEFDNTTLIFNSGEAIIKWISPASIIPAGQVIVATESAANNFVITRSDGSAAVGVISTISGDFALATGGETFYAYEDNDDDPTNGVVDIHAVLFTGGSSSGGNIPTSEDPSGIYLSALVVDGFAASEPNRTEYDPTKRNVLVDIVDFEDVSNWIHAQTNQPLSTVKFDDLVIVDIIPPVVACQNINVYLDENGSFTVDAANVDNGSTDDIGIASMSLDKAIFDCNDIGTNNIKLYVFDAAGNNDSCTAVITVMDTLLPTAVCKNIDAYLDVTGNVSIVAADIDGGSSDNCSAVTLSVSQTDFTCEHIGTNDVKLFVEDAEGNKDTCEATVTVIDNVAPTAVCNDITVYLDDSGTASITASGIDNGSTDKCGIVSITASQYNFGCADAGLVNVTLTVSDASGNNSTCISSVTVSDTISPVAVCKDTTIYLTDASGIATITASEFDNGSSDICGIGTYTASQTSFSCADIGNPVNVILTVTDENGNSSTCSSVVNVVDTKVPAPICINGLVANLDATGKTTIYPTDFIASPVIDNCGPVTYSFSEGLSQLDLTCADAGTKVVQIHATDVNGNSDYCETYVLVQDNLAPTAVCKDINVYLDETGNVSIVAADIDGGSSDNCGAVTLSISPTAFTCADIGPNNVTLTVTDDYGNTATCVAVVTVVDDIPPTIICQDPYILPLDASGQVDIVTKLSEIITSVSDNCTVFGNTVDVGVTGPRYYTCDEVGDNTVTVFLTDDNGNRGSTTFTLKVVDPDSQAPTAICKNIEVVLDATGNASINAADLDNGSNDDCGAVTFSASQTEFTCDDIGANAIILTVTDAGGLTATCTATVTVTNSVLLTALCKNIDVYLDDTGNTSITAADIDGGSSGGCGTLILLASQTDFTCDNLGVNSVTLTVSDGGGNTSSCVATVTVIDNIAPIANCRHKTVRLDENGEAKVDPRTINNGSWDVCGIQTFSLKPNSFTASNIGVNKVVLTVTDKNGNVSTCESTVTVVDDTPPDVLCNTAEFVITNSGQYELTPADIDVLAAGTNDNVSAYENLVINVSPMVLTCSDVGETTITIYASDEAGNIDSCTVQVGVTALAAELGLDSIADVTADEDTLLTVSLTGIAAGNVCGEQVKMLTASSDNANLINGLTVNYASNETNGTLDIDLVPNESGKANISVKLEDSSGNQIVETFMLTINPINDSPVVVQELSDHEIMANETLELELSKILGVLFDDVDDASLVYSVSVNGQELPDWATTTEDADMLTLNFEPLLSDTGCYNIVIEAEDIAGEIASSLFKLCVVPVIVGIYDLDEALFEVTMYPNPTKGVVTVKHEIAFAREIEIAVINIAGSEVFRKKFLSSNPIQFDLSDEVSGMYLVNIKIDEHHFIRKLILDRK